MQQSSHVNRSSGYCLAVAALCLSVLAAILVAGLWPFHAPRNHVTWLPNRDGLSFSTESAAASAGAFHPGKAAGNRSETIELWVVPASSVSPNTIVAFDQSDHAGPGFLIRQYKDELIVRRAYMDQSGATKARFCAVDKAASAGKPVFLTVTMAEANTAIYLDAELKNRFVNPGVSVNNLSGRMVLGNSAQGHDSWPGEVLGFATYETQLSPSQIAEHYRSWKENGRPAISADESPAALYLFHERSGQTVANQIDPTNALVIPDRYFTLHPPVLASVKADYQPRRDYWLDVAVNVVGFIPFGFVFFMLWSQVLPVKYPAVTTVVAGFLVSLTIELLQVFLPTRNSGSTDLITNTLGTFLGVMLFRSPLAQSTVGKIHQWFLTPNQPRNAELRVKSWPITRTSAHQSQHES